MAGLGFQITSLKFSSNESFNNNQEQTLTEDLLKDLDYNILYLNFSKLLLFLENDNTSEICFPFISKRYHDIFKRIALDVNVLKSKSLDANYRYICNKILDTVNLNKYVYMLEYVHEQRKEFNNVLVLKKIYLKNDVTIPPLCLSSSSSRSLDSLEDSQSSMDEYNDISRSNTPGSVNKDFKLYCLKTALAFVKNDDIKRIEFPNLNLEQHKFVHTLLISVVAFAEFDSNFGVKDLYRALWEAIKIYSLKYYFRVKNETEGDKKSLVFLKLPKSNPDSDKTSKKKNNKKVESNTKLTKKQKKTVKMNNIKLLVENLRPSLITDTLNKVIYLLSDEQEASCIFQPKNEQESEFYSSVLRWAREMLTRPIFSEQDGRLFDRIAELLNQAKCNVVTSKKNRRNNKTEFRQITYIKKPKFASFSKSRNKSNKEKQLLEEDRVNSEGSINNPTKKKNKSKKEKKNKKDKMTSESSASSDVSLRNKSKIEEQIKSNSSDMSKEIQIQRNLHFFNFLSKKAKKKLTKKLSLQQLAPAVQQPVEPVRQSEKIEALLSAPNTITNKLMKIDFKPASSKAKSVIPDLQDSGSTPSTSDRCSQDKKQEFTVKTIADIPKHVRDAIPERFWLTTGGTENSRCVNDRYRKSQLMEGLQVPVHSEKAMRMMKGMGWSGGALGVRGNGITEPLMPVLDTIKGRGLGHVDSKINIKPKNISTSSLLGEYKPNMSTTSLLGEYNPNIMTTISLLGAYRTYSMWKKINYEVNIPTKPKPPSTTSLAAEKVTAKQKICTWNICNFVNKVAIESKTLSTTSLVEEINTSNSIEEKSKFEQKDITKSESISTPTLLGQEVNKSNISNNTIEEKGNFEEKLTDNSNTISKINNVEQNDATEPKPIPPTTGLAEEKASSKSKMCTWNICNFVNEVNEAATKSKTVSTTSLVEEVHKSNITAEKNNFEKLKSISTPSLVDEELNKSNSTWKNSYFKEKDATELKTLSTISLVDEKVTTKSMSIWNISNFVNKVVTNTTNTKTVSKDSLVEEPQDKKDDYVEEKVAKNPKAVSKAIDLEENVVTELKIVSEASHIDEQVATKPKAIEEIVTQQETKDGTREKYSKSESKWIFDELDRFDITPTARMETDVIIAKTNELLKDNYTFGNLMKNQNSIQSFRPKLLMGMLELLSSNETTKVLKYESTINKKNRNFLVNATNALGHRERINLSSMQQCYADAIYKKYMELPGVIITGRLCNDNEILLTKTITKEDENTRIEAWVSQVTETNMETFIQSLEPTCLTKKNFNDLKFRLLILLKILFFLKTDDDDLDVAFYNILPERKRQHIQAVVEDVNLRLLFGNSRCERRVTLEISKYIKDTYLGMMFSHDFTALNLTKFTFNKRSER